MPRHRVRPFLLFPARTSTIIDLGLIGLVVRSLTTRRSSAPTKGSAAEVPVETVVLREIISDHEGIFSLNGRRVYVKRVKTADLFEGGEYRFPLTSFGT